MYNALKSKSILEVQKEEKIKLKYLGFNIYWYVLLACARKAENICCHLNGFRIKIDLVLIDESK